MKLKQFILFLLLLLNTLCLGQNVFFNEIDHINPDLCVEIAAAPDIDISHWTVTSYDDGGTPLDTFSLNIPPTSTTPSGYSIVEIDIVMLSPTNGGFSLFNDMNDLIQFISYGGEITAVGGPAVGQTSENIGTQTASGNSQQLQGIGSEYIDFEWGIPGDASCGFENDGQTLLTPDMLLPVEFLYFKGEKLSDHVLLSWSTMTERNNNYFAIEKSFDGYNFEEIGRVNGAVNSSVELLYDFPDYSPIASEVYYRLAQIDLDESITYSDIIIIEFEIEDPPINISPNPAKDKMTLHVPFSSEKINLFIHDSVGRRVFKKTIDNTELENIDLDIHRLVPGSYILSIQTDNQQFYKNFIKGY